MGAHPGPVVRIGARTAPRRNHNSLGQNRFQLSKGLRLEGAEARLPVLGEDGGHRLAGGGSDTLVEVHEGHAEPGGDPASDFGLARPHETHQKNRAPTPHAPTVPDSQGGCRSDREAEKTIGRRIPSCSHSGSSPAPIRVPHKGLPKSPQLRTDSRIVDSREPQLYAFSTRPRGDARRPSQGFIAQLLVDGWWIVQ